MPLPIVIGLADWWRHLRPYMPLRTWRLDGTTEGMGEEPDIRVELTAEDYRLGRDPQLERAIHEILKQLNSAPSM